MITKFKLYEELNVGEPEVGDYIISDIKINGEMIRLNNLIGKYSKFINNHHKDDYNYIVYYTIPDNFLINDNILKRHGSLNGNRYKINLSRSEIEYWSKDKEDLEDVLATKDFNL